MKNYIEIGEDVIHCDAIGYIIYDDITSDDMINTSIYNKKGELISEISEFMEDFEQSDIPYGNEIRKDYIEYLKRINI